MDTQIQTIEYYLTIKRSLKLYHIFFIHLPIIVHLGCFSVLAVVNNAAVNVAGKLFS